MTVVFWLPARDPEESLRIIRDRFQRGDSITSLLVVLSLFAILVFLVGWLSRRSSKAGRASARDNPQRLFRTLLERLPLTTAQREWFGKVVAEVRLEHPTVLLLSRDLYDRHFGRGSHHRAETGHKADRFADAELAAAVRRALFPGQAGDSTGRSRD